MRYEVLGIEGIIHYTLFVSLFHIFSPSFCPRFYPTLQQESGFLENQVYDNVLSIIDITLISYIEKERDKLQPHCYCLSYIKESMIDFN